MAKSRETFNKKEKEKQRQKKKQEKEDRREARKSSSSKGSSLDDMIAYVDENGNITSTPPDLSKKKAVNQNSIQISVSRQEDRVEELQRKGTVTFFNESKGYGFIKDLESQESVFVHMKALSEPIKERDKVTFEIEMTAKGASAVNVQLIK